MGKINLYIILFILVFTSVYAQTTNQPDRAYYDQQFQKVVAQINSKIDSQVARIETNVKTEGENLRVKTTEEVSKEVKNHLKSLAIGISGIIFFTLAVFKLIDIQLSSTRNIKKYEKELQKKIKLVEEYQKEMIRYKEHLKKINTQNIPIPKKKKFDWKIFIMIFMGVMMLMGFPILIYLAIVK